MYAAMSAITILSKEESYHTAEFLFTHPLSRIKITLMKLLSVTIYVTLMAIVFLITGLISFLFFEGPLPYQELIAYHGSQWLMFLQIMGICFLLSAFYRKQNIGTGLGLVLILYFLLIVYNLSEDMWFLRYVTPFIYADAALILGDGILRVDWILFGSCWVSSVQLWASFIIMEKTWRYKGEQIMKRLRIIIISLIGLFIISGKQMPIICRNINH